MRWNIAYILIIELQLLSRTSSQYPYVDYSVEPCDDFYKFACGNFENIHPIPSNYDTWDLFIKLQKEVDERLKDKEKNKIVPLDYFTLGGELLEGQRTAKSSSKYFTKAREMYGACMDVKTRDRKGIAPMYRALRGWPTNNKYDVRTTSKIRSADWIKMANFVANYGVQFLFKLTIRTDILNVTRTSIYIERDELNLPTSLLPQPIRILDNNLSSRTDSTFTNYLFKIMRIMRDFSRADISDMDLLIKAKNINDYMILIRDLTDSDYGNDNTTTYIPNIGSTTLAELQKWTDEILNKFTDGIEWRTYLQTAFKKSGVKVNSDTQIFITNRNLLRNLLIYAHQTEKELMYDFVYSRLATFMAPELSSDLYNISIDFYANRGYIPSSYPRWKYCLHKVLDFPKIGLSFAVAQKYREIYVREETIEKAKEMIDNLRNALEELIEEADWMDEWTRRYAIYKLKNILILTGGPDYLKTGTEVDRYYRKLKIFQNDHFGNTNRLRSFSQRKNFDELRISRNRNSWTQSPLIVNAYYNGLNNRILFPISTMSAPFFNGNKTSLLDYAGIGSVMAHELTHAFDSQGKLLDAEGSIVSWWSQSTAEIYENKTECFIEQYNRYTVKGSDSSNVNGVYTLPENIADNVGLRAAYRAFAKERSKLIYSNAKGRINDRYFTDQEFYLAFASIWCHVGKTLKNDKHAPHKYRVLGPIENVENFSKIWRCDAAIPKTRKYWARSRNLNKDVCMLW